MINNNGHIRIENYFPLVRGMAVNILRSTGTWDPLEELVGDGMLGLAQAYRGFSEQGAKFSTYANPRIYGAIIEGLRSRSGYSKRLKKVPEQYADIELVDYDDPLQKLLRKERVRMIWAAVLSLPKAERLIITCYYYEDLSYAEISEVLQETETWVFRCRRKAMERLRGELWNTFCSG